MYTGAEGRRAPYFRPDDTLEVAVGCQDDSLQRLEVVQKALTLALRTPHDVSEVRRACRARREVGRRGFLPQTRQRAEYTQAYIHYILRSMYINVCILQSVENKKTKRDVSPTNRRVQSLKIFLYFYYYNYYNSY